MSDREILNAEVTIMGRAIRSKLSCYVGETICPVCGRPGKIWFWRRNSCYVNDALNWVTSCQECKEEDDAYYEDLWSNVGG